MSKSEFKGNKLTIYLFGDAAKTITTRTLEGQSWYMAKDICRLVGIVGYSQAVNGERKDDLELKDSERRKESIHIGNYGKDHVLLVNNGGMLKLIYQAEAVEFLERIEAIPRNLRPPQWHEYLTWEE